MQTRFILINPSHAGNVGAAARAIKNMGFGDMVLVAPRWPNVLRRAETIARASGATDVLDSARIVDTLDDALDGMTHLCATARVARDFGPPVRTPRQHFEGLLGRQRGTLTAAEHLPDPPLTLPSGVAFLFGSERFGMSNEDVYRCHVCLCIPANPAFASLNLAQALQVVGYEWRQALGGFEASASWMPPAHPSTSTSTSTSAPLADAREQAGLLAHWRHALSAIGFLDPKAPKKLMPRLNQMVNRAGLTQPDIHILRGIARAVLQQAGAGAGSSSQAAPLPTVHTDPAFLLQADDVFQNPR